MTLATFGELIIDLNDQITENLGAVATFTPLTGDPVTVDVIFDCEVEYLPDSFLGQVAAYVYYVHVSLDKLGVTPVVGDVFTVHGTNYEVKEPDLDQTDEDWFKMKVKA